MIVFKPKKFFLLSKILKYLIFISFLFSLDIDKYPIKNKLFFLNVEFKVVKNGTSPNRYIWLHGDEKTAEMALNSHIKDYPGIAFFIKNEEREIPYKSTIIDPNRLFSRIGAYHALKKFKPNWEPNSLKDALDEIEIERERFLKSIMPPKNGVLISVHNNFRGYNVKSEIKNSQKVSIKDNQNPRDFILCTSEADFLKLEKGPYNIVLQNKLPDKDDGSLSWALLKKDVRYINVETRLGYLTQQKKILSFIEKELN
jgi:hypothetical protein